MNGMIKWSKYYIYISALLGGAGMLASCQSELLDDYATGKNGNAIQFGVSLEEQHTVYSRGAGTRGNPGLDSIYVAHTPWDNDFYVQLNTTNETDQSVSKIGVYTVPSAYEGRLEPKQPDQQLDWENLDKEHTFYSWTVPWMETSPSYLAGAAGAAETETQYYTPSTDTIPVYFYNSSEEFGYDEHNNNAVLEGLIGAKSNSYSYANHGKYVELSYHHLVSRIIIESLILIQTDGSVQKNLQADMTFVGMPIKATLYPHPQDNLDPDYNIPNGSGPRVGGPYIESPDTGVTYYIANMAGTDDIFYICPETDFSEIDFQIKLKSEDYLKYKTYYGTFNDVVFKRNTGWGYDQGDDETGLEADQKILHAGEEMRLNIVLIPGVGPGLKVIIRDWSTDKPYDSEYHSYPGIYSDAEIQQFIDMMFNFTEEDYKNPPPELEMFYEIYGHEENGKKYLPLYENVTLPRHGNSDPSNIFPVPDGYVIDGMGHTVTMSTNGPNQPGHEGQRYFNVGPVRDIYLTDGTYTIYIDPEGWVCILNEATGIWERTEKLPELTGEQKGYDINIKGHIRVTNYFNDHIVG